MVNSIVFLDRDWILTWKSLRSVFVQWKEIFSEEKFIPDDLTIYVNEHNWPSLQMYPQLATLNFPNVKISVQQILGNLFIDFFLNTIFLYTLDICVK